MEKDKNYFCKIIINFACVAITSLLIFTIIKFLFDGVFSCGHEFRTKDLSQYGKYYGHIEKEREQLNSYLMIFPKVLPNSARVQNYYYFCSNKGFDNSYEIYLNCTLNESDYVNEIKRMFQIRMKYKGEIHNVIHDTVGFNYPAYITVFNSYGTFEYALVNEAERQIVYIYSQVKGKGLDKKVIDTRYMAKDFVIPVKLRGSESEGYNMYYYKINDNDRIIPREEEIDSK